MIPRLQCTWRVQNEHSLRVFLKGEIVGDHKRVCFDHSPNRSLLRNFELGFYISLTEDYSRLKGALYYSWALVCHAEI